MRGNVLPGLHGGQGGVHLHRVRKAEGVAVHRLVGELGDQRHRRIVRRLRLHAGDAIQHLEGQRARVVLVEGPLACVEIRQPRHLPQARAPGPAEAGTAQAPAEAVIDLDPGTGALPSYIEQLERAAIQKALEENRWNKTRTAAQLGITFRALRYKLKKLGMD